MADSIQFLSENRLNEFKFLDGSVRLLKTESEQNFVFRSSLVRRLPDRENCVIVRAFVFTGYWHVTDGRTDIRRRLCLSRALAWLSATKRIYTKVSGQEVNGSQAPPRDARDPSEFGKRDSSTIQYKINKCIGDDTKAAARQSPNCIKKQTKNKIWRKTSFNMADGIYTLQCGTIMTLISPGDDCTLQCGMWLWDRDSEFTKWLHPAM